MATWVCPSCSARMTVKDELLGQVRACVKCGVPSTIQDSDDVSNIVINRRPPVELPKPPAAVSMLPRIMLAATAAGMLLCGLVMNAAGQNPYGSPLCFGAIVIVVQSIMIWPFYTMADDIHALRVIADSNQ